MDQQSILRYINGLSRGLGADNLGMPVDAAANLLNLGLAGVGYAGHKTGLLKEPLPLIEKPVGGSDWLAEKFGTPDDGSKAYTYGRMTPLAVGLARPASRGAVKLLDEAMSSGGRAGTRAAQRGAIRVSRGPGDVPDQELIASHSLDQDVLPQLATKTGKMELYSPSIGIKRNAIMTEFGDTALIPRLGAYDPATSHSTLFNRDAYTARHGDFQGAGASEALRPISQDLRDTDGNTFKVIKKFLGREYQGNDVTWHGGQPLADNVHVKPLYDKFAQVADDLGPTEAWNRLIKMDTRYFEPKELQGLQIVHDAVEGARGLGKAKITTRPDVGVQARYRVLDRTSTPHRPEDLRLNEGGVIGMKGGTTADLYHDLAITTSPAFRSFKAYEQSPIGGKLLKDNPMPETAWQKAIVNKAMGDDFGWLGEPAKKEIIQMVGQGKKGPGSPGSFETFMKEQSEESLLNTNLWHDYKVNGFTREQFLKDLPHVYKQAALARRAIQHTPSRYAELKVIGSTPLNRDSFAGAVFQDEARTPARTLLEQAGIPIIERHSQAYRNMSDLEIVEMLQKGMAAGRQPAK